MKNFGILLIVVGVIWGVIAFNMNTSVETESKTIGEGIYSVQIPSQTVHNLALADQRRNHLIGAGIALVSGIILFGFGSLKPNGGVDVSDKKCPFCAEHIKLDATICRFCGKDLPELEKVKMEISNLLTKGQDRTKCPKCKITLRLDDQEIQANQFECPYCKTEVKFTVAF